MNAKIPVRSVHIDYEHLYERIKMYRKEKTSSNMKSQSSWDMNRPTMAKSNAATAQ